MNLLPRRSFEYTFATGEGRITWRRFYVADIGSDADNHEAAARAARREYPDALTLSVVEFEEEQHGQ